MPISDCEVRDPRIRRTRQMLQAALRTLMQTRSFDDISVHDITDAATINRATFYDHYTDKYALMAAMVAGGFHGLLHERSVLYTGPGSEGALILAVCDFLVEMHSTGECEKQNPFEPLMDAAIVDAIRKVLLTGMADGDNLTAAAASWSIYGAVREWLKTSGRPPASEIVPVVQAMVNPMLEAERKEMIGR